MKGKLIKKDDHYFLEVDIWLPKVIYPQIIANTFKKPDGDIFNLSKQNCDEIFGVVDVEKLADYHFSMVGNEGISSIKSFKIGFNKAMELNKDKVFTLEDIVNAFNIGVNSQFEAFELNLNKYESFDRNNKNLLKFTQSLQKPTEIEVEIKLEPCFYDDSLGGFSTSYTKDKPKEQPKIDSSGCLILKKI